MDADAIKNFSDLVVTVNSGAIISDVSPCCEAILGYSAEKLLGFSLIEFLDADSVDTVLKSLRAAAADPGTGQFPRCRVLSETGTWVHLEAIVRNRGLDLPRASLRIDCHDITEQAQFKPDGGSPGSRPD